MPRLDIVSGTGDGPGIRRPYLGTLTAAHIRARLTMARCGDGWAYVIYSDDSLHAERIVTDAEMDLLVAAWIQPKPTV